LFLEQVEGGRILTNPEQSEFIEGSIVSVLGIADEGYRFDRWLGSLSGDRSAGTLIIDEAKSVSAVFVEHRAPEIASELSVERVKVGDDFAIEAVVTGTAPLSFQWLKDGASWPGATSATLSIPAAQPDDSGVRSGGLDPRSFSVQSLFILFSCDDAKNQFPRNTQFFGLRLSLTVGRAFH
jgi:hypothetical protein